MKRMSYDEFREQLFSVVEKIKTSIGGDAYFHSQLPCEFDSMLGDAIQHYIIEEPEEVRRLWACSIFSGAYGHFGAYATRGAMIAVREGSVEILMRALIAASIEMRGIDDYRLSFITLSLVHHSAVLLGVDIGGLFQQAEVYSASRGGLKGFLDRSDHDKSIQAMGYHQWDSPAGIIYWPELEQAPAGWRIKP
ncbi:MAG: hypothetical protein ABFD04_14480 [Syntrophomonas sp.]